MWRFEHTERTSADPVQIWARYADPSRWSEWDHDVRRASLDGPFAQGSTGTLTPASGPTTKFRVTELVEGRVFVDESRLPGATMTFGHELSAGPDGTTVLTHTITISGPLSGLFGRLVGRRLAAGLLESMRRLAALAGDPAR